METQISGPVKKKRRCQVEKKERRVEELSVLPLPVDIVLSSILSHLTMAELARTSLVSHAWARYWRHIPVLHFDNPIGMKRLISSEVFRYIKVYYKVHEEEMRNFVKWVDINLTKHMATFIDEFKVSFYLEKMYQKRIDKWVVWALSKHVQRLELDFNPPRGSYLTIGHQYILDKPLLLGSVKPVLTSLCLTSVNVSNDFIGELFRSCGNLLETLSIENSENLTRIKANNNVACSALRSLKIYKCTSMETIDINSPKLETFEYDSGFLGLKPGLQLLCIENASSLSHVTIRVRCEDRFFVLLRSLAKYFSHLEDLKLIWSLNSKSNAQPVVDYFPVLAKLKHLEMRVWGNRKRNLAGWIPFIQACPILHKLTMELRLWLVPLRSKNMKRDKHPLLHLKTFEIIDFNGENVDIDVAKFVFENCVALEEVIFQGSKITNNYLSLAFLKKLKIPQTVKLIGLELHDIKLKALKEVASVAARY